jgi:hypothetical protein
LAIDPAGAAAIDFAVKLVLFPPVFFRLAEAAGDFTEESHEHDRPGR